jgi:hypothetical protein
MGCTVSKEPKIVGLNATTASISSVDVPLRIKIPSDISKKEKAILPIKPEYNGSYFRD